jgi:hypothetical protein
LFGKTSQQADDDITERAGAINPWFREAAPTNAVTLQQFNVFESGQGPLSSQSVQGPEEKDVKPSCRRIAQHLLKCGAFGFSSRLVVFVFLKDRPILGLAAFSKL